MIKLRNAAVALTLCAAPLATGALVDAGAAHAQGGSVAADPSSQQIYATAHTGNLAADELANAADANMGGADFGLNADNGSWDDGSGGVDGGADFGGGGGGWS